MVIFSKNVCAERYMIDRKVTTVIQVRKINGAETEELMMKLEKYSESKKGS